MIVLAKFFSPAGYWIVARENIGGEGWVVWVYDFASWKHHKYEYATEAEARTAAALWSL